MIKKVFFKRLLLIILSVTGFLKFLHYKNRHKICVLMLHGVMTAKKKSAWSPLRPQLEPEELERTLALLSKFYQFITVDQAIAMLQGKELFVDNPMLITFDDGYRNNIDYALPICKQFGIKPIIFLSTKHVDSGMPFWFDRLDFALQQNMGKVISISYSGKNYSFDATSRVALSNNFKRFRDEVKCTYSDDIEMDKLFNSLSDELEIRSGKALKNICEKDDWSAIISWRQLREEVKSGSLDVGSHTLDHWRLDSLNEEQILSQLKQSKVSIEDKLTVQCDYFCYPNGNYNKNAKRLVQDTGYLAAFSTDVGLCKIQDDLMTLKRFNFPANKTKSELLYLLNIK